MIATVDSFIKIFKFYQDNALTQYFLDRGKGTTGIEDGIYDREKGEKVIDLKTKKYKRISLNEIFKINSLRYEDTVDVYLHSLVLDKYTQLSYSSDSDTIQTALSAREKMKTYFTNVLYPGSYAFNTVDNSSFRRILLDWTSTIKTIQDSNKRLTDAYSLNSEDVDKALKGFGIDFINQSSLTSINRRKNFLLNVCDLYSIKGTPQSIVQALNVIGLENIFLCEGWMFENEEDDDIKIDWQPVKKQGSLNEVTKQYENDDSYSEMVTDWNWFEKKINDSAHFDPHWFYTKDDVRNLNHDNGVYMKLPSITPYFGIEFITDADKQIDSLETVYAELNKQFQKFLNNKESDRDYKLWLNEYENKLSILQAYTGLVYSLVRFDDHVLYENFKSFLTSCEIKNIPDFTGKYEYFQLIYWFYRNYGLTEKTEYGIINSFIPIKSQDYCNYEQVLRWWLECDYTKDEENELSVHYIKPTRKTSNPGFIELTWKSPFDYGRYTVQGYNSDIGWFDITTGNYSYQSEMVDIVAADKVDDFGLSEDRFRIAYYHTPANLPDLFFKPPFNLNNQLQDTFLDRTVRYNGPSVCLSFYNDNIIKNAFSNQHIPDATETYDVISGYHRHSAMDSKIRVAEIDTTMRTMYSSIFNYPTLTRLYEDKWMNINNDFYNFVDWSIKDFTDTKSHEGMMYNNRNMIHSYNEVSIDQNIIGKTLAFDVWCENDEGKNEILFYSNTEITLEVYNTLVEKKEKKKLEKVVIFGEDNFRKYPVNSKWNWAIDSNYLYYCYESNKWCRIPVHEFTETLPPGMIIGNLTYGGRYCFGNKLYVYIALNKFAVVDCETTWDVNESDILPKCEQYDPETGTKYWECGRIKEGSKLSRDLAVAQIKDSYILELIYKDCILSNKNSAKDDIIKILDSEEIEVFKDPYKNSHAESYNYDTLLKYLYNSRLILDFSTGYIYPNYQAALCGRSIYLKSFIDSNALNKIWIKINPEFEWNDTTKDGVAAETIYSDWILTRTENEKTGKVVVSENRKSSTNLDFLMPPYTLANRYDSLRFIDGPMYDSPLDLQKDSDDGNIDKSVNYVLVRPCTYTDTDLTGNVTIYTLKNPTIFKRVPIMNDSYTGITYRWERCLDNHIYDCNYGICPQLLEFIESRYAQDSQYYITMINDFTEVINTYMTEELGISGALLDLTIVNWISNGIVKKTVTFYKPKRARLLFISNTIEGDYGIGNNLDRINIGDQDFNYYDLAQYRFGNPQFDKKNLNRMNRQKISQSISDYIPHSDTIYKKSDESNELYTAREIYSLNTKVPSLEVYDQLLNLNNQINSDIPASFYVCDLELENSDERVNGFYYKIPNEDTYTNNNYFFKKVVFLYTTSENNRIKIHNERRWAIFKCDTVEPKQSNCIFVAECNSDVPYNKIVNGTICEIKYALRDYKNNPNYVDNLDYSRGDFTSSGVVKTNRRIIEPVFYISQFENRSCSGFYYHDEKLYPSKNDKPVYFNQNGKIISYVEEDWIIPFSAYDNKYDKDDKWRMTSTFDFYNNKTLIETQTKINGYTVAGYGYKEVGKLIFFLYRNESRNEWIFIDYYNNITRNIESDNKTFELSITIDDITIQLERYARTNKFWIVTDNKEIIEFKDADYFAYCYVNDESIWNPRNNDITKVFHKSKNKEDDVLTWGIRTSRLYDNEELIDPIYGYNKPIYDNYGLYRRNHFNMIELKNKPISYLYCYNHGIKNFYNDDNKIKIETNSTKYSIDKEGNPFGAVELHNENYLRYTNIALQNKDNWSIAFRMLAFDNISLTSILGNNSNLVKPNNWFMITMTSIVDYDHYLSFAFLKLKKDCIDRIEFFKEHETLIRQIHFMKDDIVQNIIYQFGIQISDDYADKLVSLFSKVSTYQDSIVRKYDDDKLIEIRDSIINELLSVITSIDGSSFPKTENNLHTILKYTGYVSQNKALNCDYYNFYIDGKLVRNNFDGNSFFTYIDKNKLEISNANVKISEYAVWEYALSDWYCDIISKFRILRSRPEPQKSKTSVSKNNYRPLFVLEQPRIVYPQDRLGVPENTNGDRLEVYNADPGNKGDKNPSEVNPLWRLERPFDENNKSFVKDGAECYYPRNIVHDGKEYRSSSDYKVDCNEIPYWWIKKPYLYSSGPVHHKPVYISLKQRIDDVYPRINDGIEDYEGNYHDIGMNFDGVNNEDTSYYDGEKIVINTNKDKTYFDITYDPNSSFTSEYDKYVLSEYDSDLIIAYAKNKKPLIKEDEEKESVYEVARNFYPIGPTNKIKYLRLRYIDIDNNGSKFTSIQNEEDIIVPDIAQLTLTKEQMSNGIFHNDLKFYIENSDYSCLCGIWTPSNTVKSYQDGDFNYCYKNSNNCEAVLTYQRNSGYFWWEFRKKENSQWKTIARTYVQPKHNLSKTIEWKDYVNWNQIDLCGQVICKFNESDYEDFATKSWGLVNQEVIEYRRFTCGSWIKFQLQEVNKEYEEPVTSRTTYFDGKYIYFLDPVSNKWFRTYQKCETDWNDGIFDVDDIDIELKDKNYKYTQTNEKNVVLSNVSGVNGKPRTPSGFLYRNGYLYFYVDIDNRWVRLPITNVITTDIKWSKHYRPWEFYKSRDTMFGYMNVIDSTECNCFDNCYVIPNSIDIIETYEKMIKFNGLSDFEWSNHVGEDILYPKSVNNDISLCRCSVKDSVHVYVYETINNIRKLLNQLEASVIRSSKPVQQVKDSYSRSMINFFEFPLYGNYDNDHIKRNIW